MARESLDEREEACLITGLLLLTVLLFGATILAVHVLQIAKVFGVSLPPVHEGYHLSAVRSIQTVAAQRVRSVHLKFDAVVLVVVLQLVV